MAKPNPVDITDSGHHPQRAFKCTGENVFRLIGTDFDDDARVSLNDPQNVGQWINPPGVHVIKHGLELQINAKCVCRHATFFGFFLRLLWPLLWALGLVIHKHFGIGSLTVTVTNDSGDSGTLTYPDNTITYN